MPASTHSARSTILFFSHSSLYGSACRSRKVLNDSRNSSCSGSKIVRLNLTAPAMITFRFGFTYLAECIPTHWSVGTRLPGFVGQKA
ncbi:Uncharacterised protein [Mycobacteroides abscessus subsp. abscessus]|nr:Uncharacterised protein [Mycobacteroides abscessus subsp. abscessus]